MNCIERLNTLPATAQEKKWLEKRLATLSEKESLVLDAAILRSPPESASEAINHLLRLEDYEVCCRPGVMRNSAGFICAAKQRVRKASIHSPI